MGKKQNEATPNVNATANRDVVQRLNFLYQASVYLQSIAPPSSPETNTQGTGSTEFSGKNKLEGMSRNRRKSKKHDDGYKKTAGDLGRSYVQCMRTVGQKSTVKMDPSMKRALCSSCNTTLVVGSSASVRVKPSRSHGHIMVYTCLHCKAAKRIPAPPNGSTTSSSTTPSADYRLPQTESAMSEPSRLEVETTSKISRRKKERLVHHLPLFARRDAGHAVFRGNERLPLDQEGGLGVAFI